MMTPKQTRYLRSLGHDVKSTIKVGKSGITKGLLKQINDHITAHELIKVTLQKIYGPERLEMGQKLAELADAELVQVIGGSVLLYKPHPDKPKIRLPR